MSEEDKDEARHREVIERIDKLGEQNSAQHGSIVNVVNEQNRETRAHIGSEVETIANDMAHHKNFMDRMLRAMKRFLARHGIGSDDL